METSVSNECDAMRMLDLLWIMIRMMLRQANNTLP